QHMGLGETDFLWLFGPSTLGMMTGSFIATKVAHLWSVTRILVSAFGFMLAAMIWNLSVGLYQPEDFGWYLPYMFIYTVGLALAMPTVNLMGLDCVPSRRGMGASLQLFVQTAFNALIAALLAPFFWETPLKLAAG